MTEEQLQMIIDVEREDAEIPETWQALAEGTASDETIAALRAEAEHDETARRRFERFRPLEPQDDEQFTAALLEQVRTDPQTSTSRGRWLRWLVPLAVAATLVFWIWPTTAPIPAYQIDAAIGDRPMRSVPTVVDGPVHRIGSTIALVLRPQSVAPDVVLDTFLLQSDEIRPITIDAEIASSGAIRIDGRVEALLPGVTGEITLLFVIRSSGSAKPTGEEAKRAWTNGEEPKKYRVIAYRCSIATS